MGAHCCNHDAQPPDDRYRTVLWAALAINAAMFLIEIGAGLAAGSVSLQADALDFLGDAASYGVSLVALGLGARARAGAALLKGGSMGLFGIWVLASTAIQAWWGTLPTVEVMGAVGLLALAANLGVAALLFAWRNGDANMRSVWLCTRNDVIGNLAVLLAATGVLATGTNWPDLMVATIMAALALSAALQVVRRAHGELRETFMRPA